MKLDQLGQDDFERALVDSAASDVPCPEARQRAWAQFAAAAGGIAATLPPAAGGRSASTMVAGRSGAMRTALRWLAIGAVGGSALTLTFVRFRSPRPALVSAGWARPEPSPVLAPAVSAMGSESRETGAAAPAETGGMMTEDTPAASAARSPARVAPSLRQTRSLPLSPTESLAAEVAALDSARVALDHGAPAEALAMLDRYQRAFPQGKLATEAQVARIEALVAKGDAARALNDASRFLEEYPSAPQRGRVKALQAALHRGLPDPGK